MSYRKTMSQLDSEQLQAVTVRKNAVVAAGAGSGKTKVLAARYAHLIIEEGLSCDEILTLTFTRKAVTEMYSRIYATLSESSDESASAKKAVSEFHKAKIFTIDSYSAMVVRLASRRYGIAPDFVTDNDAASELAESAAIPFVLEHRTNPALQTLLVDNKIEDIAQKVFAKPISEYTTISRPIDFDAMLKNQAAEAARSWEKTAYKVNDSLKAIGEALSYGTKSKSETIKKLAALFDKGIPSVPTERDIAAFFDSVEKSDAKGAQAFDSVYGDYYDESRGGEFGAAYDSDSFYDSRGGGFNQTQTVLTDVIAFCRFVYEVQALRTSSAKDETLVFVFGHISALRDNYKMLASIGNYCCRFSHLCALFPLLAKFQAQILEQKRVSGVLSFADVAALAVDALSEHSDIRQAEKRAIKAIMIDEFQDDNELQRDLLFLLAEKAERTAKGIPRADELCADKLFFVGDEKQSIYRFRGADVSVFRKLSEELKGTVDGGKSGGFYGAATSHAAPEQTEQKSLNLITNYRSHPALICAFNTIFGGFALPVTEEDATKVPPRYGVRSLQTAVETANPIARAAESVQTAADLLKPAADSASPSADATPKAAAETVTPIARAAESVQAAADLLKPVTDSASPSANAIPNAAARTDNGPINAPVFLKPKKDTPLFEATYSWVKPCVLKNDSLFAMPRVTFCSFDKDENKTKTPDSLGDVELEAVFVAQKIRALVQSGYPVRIRAADGSAGVRPCTFDDITILFRATRHQYLFEKHLRAQNIPYAAENVTSFFTDAPINDLYNFLRLVVYPADTNAYASVLCSPFVRLGKNGMLQCLLQNGAPFDLSVASVLTKEERAHYEKGAELYKKLCEAASEQSIAALVSMLWYEYGYRYETMHSENVRMYGELYDYLFELARKADADGETLATFLDTICNQMKEDKKLDDIDIPMERNGGVHLMTIHKSKGLEFPIVFLVDSASGNTRSQNRDLVFIDKESDFGPKGGINFALNLPDEPRIPGKGKNGNFIFNRQQFSDQEKSCAELRRLLYVALTRAESAVFITGSETRKAEEESEEITMPQTLFGLLKPALPRVESPIFAYEKIPVCSRSEVQTLTQRAPHTADAIEAAMLAANGFAAATVTELPFIAKKYVTPSSLELPETLEVRGGLATQRAEIATQHVIKAPNAPDFAQRVDCSAVDAYITAHPNQITFADFGTIVHRFMEGALKDQPPVIPAKILGELPESLSTEMLDIAQKLAQNFLHSALGQKARHAPWVRSEYSFKCKIGESLVNGQIDLVFEDASGVTVVDFKTDATENVSAHLAQLAVYSFAAQALKGVTPTCFLYYVRSGNAVDVTRRIACIDVESLLVQQNTLAL